MATKLNRASANAIAESVKAGLTGLNKYFHGITTRRAMMSRIKLRLIKIPIIAPRVLIPGLFIGLVGSAGIIYSYDHSQNNAHALGSSVPIPAATVNGVTVGPGFVEASARQIVRTSSNKVYIITADDDPCLSTTSPTKGVIHVWKGTGAQATNANVPTGFSEVDAANRPVSAGSGSCQFSGGVTSMLLSPDIRLDDSGVIHLAYIDGNDGSVYYQTFSTVTDTWGARSVIGTGGLTDSGSGWPRGGQLALTLDSNDVPHVVYASAGTTNSIKYTDKTSGSWSAPIIVASGTDLAHPSMVTALDGTIHLTWLANSHATHSTISYARYSAGSWGAVENVSSGDSLVLANGDDDQGPSIVTDSSNRPHVLFNDGTVNGSDNYARLRYRTSGGVWTDDSPPGSAGGSASASGTWYNHTPQNYISSAGDEFIFLGHDVNISPGVYEYQAGGVGNSWSSAQQLDPRNSTNTTAGAPGLDGSASIRWDPLRDNNNGIIDVIYYDENDGTAGYNHHATVYYKAVDISSMLPGGPTANIWVDTDGGTCARSTAGSGYDTSAACSSLDQAYGAASAGDVIYVRCGNYGAQSITYRALGTSAVTISKDPSDSACSRVTVSSLDVDASYLTLSGFTGNGTASSPASFSLGPATQKCLVSYDQPGYPCTEPRTHVTLDNFSFNYGDERGVSYLTLSNGELGPLNAQSAGACGGPIDGFDASGMTDSSGSADGPSAVPAEYLTVDNVYVHDIQNSSGCGGHTDAIQGITGYSHWTVKNSRFVNNATCVLAYSAYEANPYSVDTITVENNVFDGNGSLGHCISLGNKGSSSSGSSACGSSNLNNIIQNNTFTSGLAADSNCLGSPDGIFRNNIVLPSFACSATGTDFSFSYNVFSGGDSACAGTSNARSCTPSFVSADHSTGNADLAISDTCAKDFIPVAAGTYPATDIHGTLRPQGTLVDAGADEYIIAPSVWVSASGSDATCVRGDSTKPCATFNKAYQLAFPGDTIQISAGTYSGQTITQNTTNGKPGTSAVIFKAVGTVNINGSVNLGIDGTQTAPSYITFDGSGSATIVGQFAVNYASGAKPAHDTIENTHISNMADSQGALIFTRDVSYFTASNNNIGPACCSSDGIGIEIRNIGDPVPDHIILTDNTIHDLYDTCAEVPAYLGPCSGPGFGDPGGCSVGNCDHVDGVQTFGANTLDVERNIVYLQGDHKQGLFLPGSGNGGTLSDVTVANNFVSSTSDTGVSIGCQPSGACSGYMHVLFNTFQSSFHIGSGSNDTTFVPGSTFVIAGNIFDTQAGAAQNGGCNIGTYSDGSAIGANLYWSYNLMGYNSPCNNDVAGHATFIQPSWPGGSLIASTGDPDLHLTVDSAGIDAAPASFCGTNPTYCPSIDIDNQSRPQSLSFDMGADEYLSGSGGGGDTTAPTKPAGLSKTAATATSITLTWSASTDNVGVTAYGVYKNGVLLSTPTSTAATISGLTCATSYTLAVDARDASGNRSAQTSGSFTTSSCPTSTTPKLAGDCNADGHVSVIDLSILLSHYGTNYASADFDSNHTVNVIDLSMLLSNYGR